MMDLQKLLWAPIGGIFDSILEHPSLIGLADGTLPEAAFKHYVIHDTIYLRSFARGLALLGARADGDDALMLFCNHASNAVLVERALHKGFLEAWGLDYTAVLETEAAPNTLLYTSYLIRVAYDRPYHEALGAFLPCYWIYREVGRHLESKGSPNPLYEKWIGTYGGEAFGEIVDQVLLVTQNSLNSLTEEQKEAAQRHFIMTSKLEYLFWDMGFHCQTWIV
jgi:thiaminase/transcriptional activator TenA